MHKSNAKASYRDKAKGAGLLGIVALTSFLAIKVLMLPAGGQTSSVVTVSWITPTNGSVVSGNVLLAVRATSTVAPIVKVEFFRDDILIGTWTNTLSPPSILRTN